MAPPPLRRSGATQVPAHAVTEDTPADMLTGQMSLSVLLPDGRHCRMNVDRGTPMMDLLIQVATANKISPGGHVIQVISDRSHSCLSYKPSTPIGTLDTTALRIVEKNKINELPSRRARPPPQNPLADAKIRIKVYLPRNQLSAMRVSPKTPLAEVLDQICKDKNLDVTRYELRHPVNVDERLRPSCCLADYKLQEVTVVPLNSRTNTVLSSADIIAMQKKSDGKRKIFAIFGKKSKPSVIESTASSDSLGERSVSPDGSDESAERPRSLSPQPAQVIQAPPRAKKRAAPKPPQVNGGAGVGGPPSAAPAPPPPPVAARPPSELSEGAESVESRHSSDSSGYHEAGLSDAPDSPTERAPAPPAPPSNLGSVSSYSTSNLMSSSNLTQVNSTSTVSLSSAIRKRRAPPPPAIPRIAEDPQPASAPAPPRQAPVPAAAPAPAPAAAPAAAAAAPVASSPVVQQQSQQSELAAPCSEGHPAAAATAAAAEGRVAPQPLRRSSLGARRPQPLPRLLPAGQPAAGADPVVPPPPGFDDPEPAGAVAAVRLREGLARSGQPRPASVGSRPSTLQRKKRAPPPPGPPPLASATSLPASRSPRESPAVVRATSAGDPRAPTPVSRCASSQLGSVDLTDVTSLDSFRSWSSDSEPSRAAPAAATRGQTLSRFSGESDEDGGSDGNSECAVRPRDVTSEAAARPHVIHRWRNSTNLDQLVADARGHTQEEEAGGRSAGSSASSPERTRLAAPLRQDSGTSSTETLTAESAAGSDPAPAPIPSPAEEKVDNADNARTQTPEKRQTSGRSASVERSVDHSRPAPRAETEPVKESRGSSPTGSEEEPTPAEAAEEDAVSSTVSESFSVAPSSEPEQPKAPTSTVTPAAPASPKAPVEKPAVKAPAPEVLPKPVMQLEPASELPVVAAEPAQAIEQVQTPKQTDTTEESVLEKVAPAPVPEKTRAPEPAAAAAAPAVTETSAPAAVVPTPPSPPPAPAVTSAEALPVAPRQKAPPTPPPADSGSDLSSSEAPSGAVEPSEQSGEEDDSDTAQLQREVDSALACLDNNLDEALAETAAFTESSSLQTQSRVAPAPSPAPAAAAAATEVAAVETLPAVVRESAREPAKAPRQTMEVTEALFASPTSRQAAPTSRQTVRERETVEVIDTLLPVARVAPPPAPVEVAKEAPVASPGSQEVAEEVATVVTESRQRTAPPAAEAVRDVATSRPAPSETESVPKPTAVEEPLVEAVVARRRTPKLGAANRQRPVEVQEEVVERVEKAQRKRMTSKDIKLHIERKLASFDVPPRSSRQKSQLVTPPVSAPVGAESPDWQYRLPAPPTPFQDGARVGPPLEAPLEFQDNMTVTSSEPSEVGELAEATNGPLLERVSQPGSTPACGDQSEPALENGGESDPAPASVDQWDGGRPERPAKPARRPSSERLSRQMSFSIGAYGQREQAAAGDGGVTGSRPQRADSFHCQKSSSTTAVTEQVTSASAAAGTEMSAPRRPVSRRRSSDASRVQRSAEAAEPIRPPRKYELKFNSSKSYSMLNLSNGALTTPTESPSPNMNKTQSQTDLAIESEVSDIQSEFLKLQRQFLHWQQQLLQNQSILQTKVAPLATRPSAAASLQSLEVIEELRSRVPEQNPAPEEQEPPADYAGRSQSLPRGAGLQNSKLSVAERRRGEREPERERESQREPQREPERHRQRERSPPSGSRQRASTLERRPETPPQSEPETARQRASTLERRPSETREKRVPWSPPKVALGTWADQSRQSQVQLKEDRDYVLRQAPAPVQLQSTDAEPESSVRRPTAVSVRPSKSVTVTSLGAPPPPVAAPEPSPPQSGALSAVAKVRHNETVPAPTSVLVSAPSARVSNARQPPAFSISDSKPSHSGRGGVAAAAGRFTSVVSLTDEPRQPHTVSVQVSKPIARTSRTSETATVTCRVSPADQAPSQSPSQQQPQQQTQRTVPSVVSVTRKDSATSTELAARQAGSDAARRARNQPVVKGFRQSEVPAPVPPPPPPPPAPVMPAAAEAAAGRARLRPVSSGRQVVPKLDPREELMIAIREHGGLKKRGGVRP